MQKKVEKQRNTLFVLKKIKTLFSYSYTWANLRFFLQGIKRKPFYITDTLETDDYLREPDASIWYPYTSRYPDVQKVRLSAIRYTEGSVYSLENFQYADRKRKFETLMKILKNAGVHVTLYLAPYHPLSYDILIKNPKYQLKQTEAYFRSYAKKHHLQLVGSYNPHLLGFTQEDFFDGMHCRFNAVKKIFSSWKPSDTP